MKNHAQNVVAKLFPEIFLKNQNQNQSLDQWCKIFMQFYTCLALGIYVLYSTLDRSFLDLHCKKSMYQGIQAFSLPVLIGHHIFIYHISFNN